MTEILCRWLNDDVGLSRHIGKLIFLPQERRIFELVEWSFPKTGNLEILVLVRVLPLARLFHSFYAIGRL